MIQKLDKVRDLDDLIQTAGKKDLGGVTDIDIDILMYDHDEDAGTSRDLAFKWMKPHLVSLAERSDVCFLTNSSELSRHYDDKPVHISPHLATRGNLEIIQTLAEKAAIQTAVHPEKALSIVTAIKNAKTKEELNRLVPSVIDGIDRGEFTFKDFLVALNKALRPNPVAFCRWIFVMNKMGAPIKDSEPVTERKGERVFLSVKQGKRFDKLDELIVLNERFTWKEGDEEIEALILYNTAERALKIFPTRKTLLADPELKKLDTQADDAYVPDRGLFGVIRIQELTSGDEPALWIDEVQSSIGFRQIKPAKKREKYRNWNRAAIEHIVSLARKAGFNIFYASSSQEMRGRYRSEKMNQGNLKENYHRPFRADWEKTDVVLGRRQTKLWRREMEQPETPKTDHKTIEASRAWQRLAGIGGMFPAYIKVSQDESGTFLNRERHVLRGLKTALAYSGSTERKTDPEKIHVIAYAHELGRLPFVHYAEKRLGAYFHVYKDVVTPMTVGSEVRERYNQALAQNILYEENGIQLDARTREDINNILLKQPDNITSDEAKLFFLADTMLGYVEDFVLTYKLSHEGRRIVENFPDRAGFLEFVFGSANLSEIDALSMEEFDDFVVRGASRLMETVVDRETLTFKKDAMEELERYRDSFEAKLFPSVDALVSINKT
ncbi:hypothetical protein ACFL5E_00855, partial [Candidatus Omnitrophota bacterium]